MSALTNAAETALLELIFLATTWLSLAEDKVSSPTTNLQISLHTSSPGEAGDQTTNETSYTNYVRVAVARSGSGWTVTNDTVDNDAAITFPTCGATGATISHVGIGDTSSGAGNLLLHGALDSDLAVSVGVAPEFAAGALDITAA